MTTKTEKKVAEEEVKVEEKFKPSDYSCEILLEKTTLVKACLLYTSPSPRDS